ncbi:MAG: glycerophosphodiester phosphodiesterase [Blautia sp.]|nr:glycerophosphodiester phosphodiesterase [Blautia sp.]
MERTKIWAHRGAVEYAPENTLEAFEAAVRLGADGIELDIHLTKDREIVVIHDERLERTSSGKGYVKDYTLAQLREMDFSRGTSFGGERRYQIPTMREVFELIRPTALTINIELKTNVFRYRGIERKVMAMAAEYGMSGRVCYSSFNRVSIETIHLLDPHAAVGFLYTEAVTLMPVFAKNLGISALHPAFYSLLLPDYMKNCRENGIDVNVWTIDTEEQMRVCFLAGVNAVITNYPDKARKVLEETHETDLDIETIKRRYLAEKWMPKKD